MGSHIPLSLSRIQNPGFGRLARLSIAIFIVGLYLAIPARNFYWDGIAFAQTIENAARWPLLLHANHLLYNVLGWVFYHALGGRVRAVYVLQAIDSVFAAAAFYLLSGIVARVTSSIGIALLLGAFFAFSGTWWRFAVDADAYIPSVTLLIACASLLPTDRKPRIVPAALLHSGAMLLHQLAVFFFPAVLVLLWRQQTSRRLRRCVLYVAVAGGTTLAAYIGAFSVQSGGFSFDSFGAWITSHSEDVAFSFSPVHNLAVSLRSWIQVLVAGRPGLVHYSDPLTIILLAVCASALASLLIAIRRGPRPSIAIYHRTLFVFAASWIAAYAVFLFFWLPHNTFYKLFALPGIVLLIASCWKPGPSPIAPLFVALLALCNLTFAIIPYSRATANEAVAFALSIEQHLASGSTVYYSDLNTDDWLVRYFNPQTTWRQVASPADIHSGDGAAWLDTTAIDRFSRSDPAWFEKRTRHAEWRELVNAKHRIRFVRLPPLTTESDAERTAPRAP